MEMQQSTYTTLGGKSIEEWAHERNLLALAFVRATSEMGYKSGVRLTDDPNYPALIVPLGIGEVGWHVPHDLYRDHREWLPKRLDDYNGYGRNEKNRRLETYAYQGSRD